MVDCLKQGGVLSCIPSMFVSIILPLWSSCVSNDWDCSEYKCLEGKIWMIAVTLLSFSLQIARRQTFLAFRLPGKGNERRSL